MGDNGQVQPLGFFNGACDYSLTVLIFGIGAAGLAFLAAAGGAEIGGVFFGPAALNQLAAVSASFSALYAYIDAHVC